MLGLGGYFYGGKQWENKEETPMPKDVPDVDEVGATSAPLLSASYYIGDKCKPFNEDFLLCKEEHNGGTLECMKEGRRVTRCAISVLKVEVGDDEARYNVVVVVVVDW